jgi:hypothetical protein
VVQFQANSYQGTALQKLGKARFTDEKRLSRENFDAACAAVKERALRARVPGKTRFMRRWRRRSSTLEGGEMITTT